MASFIAVPLTLIPYHQRRSHKWYLAIFSGGWAIIIADFTLPFSSFMTWFVD